MRYLIFVLMLSGCASSPKESWVKDGADIRETKAATRFCRRDTTMPLLGAIPGLISTYYFDECMVGKGFTKVTN